jgi:hypothetical protein
MGTFVQPLSGSAATGEAVNTLFEERLFGLVDILDKITDALTADRIPHELIGGLAVLVHVEEADPTYATLTRDVDLMVHRADLDRIKEAAARNGFRFRHAAGLDMLLYCDADSAKNAVRLVFSEERVRDTQPVPNPPIAPEVRRIHGKEIKIVPVRDLVRMKLSAFRDKDRVHVRSMDAAGLITAEIVESLPADLKARLQHVRETE